MGPFILKRLLLMIPTLFAISVVSFIIISIPPGDYVDRLVSEAKNRGEVISAEAIEGMRTFYGLDRPLVEQYFTWVGRIVTKGDFGISFRWNLPVTVLLGERLLLTFVLSLATLLLIWTIALPLGILSAVRQYSFWDYAFTFISFVGLAVPSFLLALGLMYISFRFFGQSVGGLFSPQYVEAPWTFAKAFDLLSHLWIPMAVLGAAGIAELVRTLRANLLDEIRKPYVTTARTKGMPEVWLLIKYPLRHALNPFVSGQNEIFVNLVSGSTIVSVVLGLQTIGPLLLEAFRGQDMFLAGGSVLILGALAVLGTVFSDILLAWVDPRVRYR